MKTITLRELHEKTGEWIRSASQFGEVAATDGGRTVARHELIYLELSYFVRLYVEERGFKAE